MPLSWFAPKPIDHPAHARRWFKAVRAGDVRTLGRLLDAGFDLSTPDRDGHTALDLCARLGVRAACQALLARHPNLQDPSVLAPASLVEAVRAHHFPVVLALLAAGAPVDTQDHTGDNLLGVLVVQEHPSVRDVNLSQDWAATAFQDLVLAGVDPDHANHQGMSVRAFLQEHLANKASLFFADWPKRLVGDLDLDEQRAQCQAHQLHDTTPAATSRRPRPRF